MDGLSERAFVEEAGNSRSGVTRIVAYTNQNSVSDNLNGLIDGEAIPWIDIQQGGIADALENPDLDAEVVILDISPLNEEEANSGIQQLIVSKSCRVIALGTRNDIGYYRSLIHSGADDYLILPVDGPNLADALLPKASAPVKSAPAQSSTSNKTRINIIVGARGGAGATTLAVDTAWWAAEREAQSVCLLDLDTQFGGCALALDLMPSRGLRDALEHPERIDSLFLGSAVMKASEGLSVLASEEAAEEEIFVSAGAGKRVAESLKEIFPCLVVDFPRTQIGTNSDLLKQADTFTIVSEMSLLGLRDALRLKEIFKQYTSEMNIRLVVRENTNNKPAITRKEFEKGYGGSIHAVIPAVPKLVGEAASSGRPLVSLVRRNHPLAKTVAGLVADFLPQGDDQKTKKKRKWLW